MKKVLLSLSFAAFSVAAFAQSGSLSPYAYYGIGALSSQGNSASRGMAGVGQAFREGSQVNFLNPASYSSIDSLSFIFDVGMSLERTFYDEGGSSAARNTADFEYLIAGFRAYKHVGVSFGILPVSTINYTFSSSKTLDNFTQYPYSIQQTSTTATTTYNGTSGSREVYIGVGWEPFKHFSIGANVMYMWGDIDRWSYLRYSDSNVKTLEKYFGQNISKIRYNVGLQYSQPLGKGQSLTIGATFTPGSGLGDDAEQYVINAGSATSDTTSYTAPGGYEMPMEIAGGIAYASGKKWRVGIDYDYQRWSAVPNTLFINDDDLVSTGGSLGSYHDRHKFSIGGEWCKNPNGRTILDRVRWRAGFSYTTPYLKMNTMDANTGLRTQHDGPREISATLGAAIPIINNYNNRSVLNIGFQWVNETGSLIRENTIRLNIALTFNERWFAKWKFE